MLDALCLPSLTLDREGVAGWADQVASSGLAVRSGETLPAGVAVLAGVTVMLAVAAPAVAAELAGGAAVVPRE